MPPAASKVLIVGGGIGGLSSAIALTALHQLGLLDEALAAGFAMVESP